MRKIGASGRELSLEEVLGKLRDAERGRAPRELRRGTVRHFDEKKGYGFISPAGGGPDIFFHKRAVQGVVQVGHSVEFDVEQGDRGPRATYVCITFIVEGD